MKRLAAAIALFLSLPSFADAPTNRVPAVDVPACKSACRIDLNTGRTVPELITRQRIGADGSTDYCQCGGSSATITPQACRVLCYIIGGRRVCYCV